MKKEISFAIRIILIFIRFRKGSVDAQSAREPGIMEYLSMDFPVE